MFILVLFVLLEQKLVQMQKLIQLVLMDIQLFLHQLFVNNVLFKMLLNVLLVYQRQLNVKLDTQLSMMLVYNVLLMLLHVLKQELLLKLLIVMMDMLKL